MESRRTTHAYRLIKSSWGISIVITGTVSIGDGSNRVADRGHSIGLSFGDAAPSLPESYRSELRRGLDAVADDIVARVGNSPVLVNIENVLFNEVDFQVDGLAVAMCRWAEKAFELSPTRILETFDRAANRYCFDWT
ncbi:hypothetical protein [Promicromonospora sp. NPDC023805]|uniref:hypothetical protein n=1 Tax=Promicromonospora sp. NPDC023805 TaxID=3154696 RepID=UPI0033E5FDB8